MTKIKFYASPSDFIKENKTKKMILVRENFKSIYCIKEMKEEEQNHESKRK